MRAGRREAGFSILEVVVALAIMSTFVLAVSSAIVAAQRATRDMDVQARVLLAAQGAMDLLAAIPYGTSGDAVPVIAPATTQAGTVSALFNSFSGLDQVTLLGLYNYADNAAASNVVHTFSGTQVLGDTPAVVEVVVTDDLALVDPLGVSVGAADGGMALRLEVRVRDGTDYRTVLSDVRVNPAAE